MIIAIYIVCSLVGMIVFILIARWLLEIPSMIKLLRVQAKLLEKIAEKQGLSKTEIYNLIYDEKSEMYPNK